MMAQLQLQWLHATLNASKADWIIVAGHYPGLGFVVEGLGFIVEGLGFIVEGLGFIVEGLGFEIHCGRGELPYALHSEPQSVGTHSSACLRGCCCHAVLSGGEHGNTVELQESLLPLMEKYGVDAYLCGHDHTLQVNAQT